MTTQPKTVGPDDDPDRYRLGRIVGSGGEAVLWKGDFELSGEREAVAIRILKEQWAAEADASHRLKEQAAMLHLINHRGIVKVHEYFEGAQMHPPGKLSEERAHYLVMNWVEGHTLSEWVAEHAGPQYRRAAFQYLRQIAEVTDSLHNGQCVPSKRVIIHGDLSPRNVLIDEDDQAVLVDFGLFQMTRAVTRMARAIAEDPRGTPGFAAPEVFEHGEYSGASDRYAFGAIVFYTLSGGQRPPEAPARLRAAMADLAISYGVSPESLPILLAIFADEPRLRPDSASDWLKLLHSDSTTTPPRLGVLPPPAGLNSAAGPTAPPFTLPASKQPIAPTSGAAGRQPGTPEPPVAPSSESVRQPRNNSRRWQRRMRRARNTAALLLFPLLAWNGWQLYQDVIENDAPGGSQAAPTTVGTLPRSPSPPASSSSPAPPGDAPTPTSRPTGERSLLSLDALQQDCDPGTPTVKGRTYPTALVCTVTTNIYINEYNLLGDYSRFRTLVGLGDRVSTGSSAIIKVAVDGRTVASATVGLFTTRQLEADVSGGQRMTISVGEGSPIEAAVSGAALINPVLVP